MPKATFEQFFVEQPMYKNTLDGNQTAEEVFGILNRDENIFLAIEFSKRGKPALLASIPQIEEHVDSLGEKSSFDLSVDFNRQCVGKMQLAVLKPFGWISIKNSAKSFTAKHFRTASCYEFKPELESMVIEISPREKS